MRDYSKNEHNPLKAININAMTLFKRGNDYLELKQFSEAIECYSNSILINPADPNVYSNRANAYFSLGLLEKALGDFNKAIELNQTIPEIFFNRGVCLFTMRNFHEALENYERALELNPHHFSALVNRGNVLRELRKLDEALRNYAQALKIQPHSYETLNNIGVVLYELRYFTEAQEAFQASIDIFPDYASAHWNLSICYLIQGNYEQGWLEFEWRWKNQLGSLYSAQRKFNVPLWLGQESLEGKTILIHAEQGLGDTLQFCRFVKFFELIGARVVLEVQEQLVELLQTLSRNIVCMPFGSSLPHYDFHCPLMSLPLAFKISIHTLENQLPYIFPDFIKVNEWQKRLSIYEGFKVGLVWSGGYRANQPESWATHFRRNIPLKQLLKIKNPQINFFSLQKGEIPNKELKQIKNDTDFTKVVDYTTEFVDFSDTAAFIQNLDLIISVDTSVAHLAGAIGKPIWLLNRYDSCWRWLFGREDSPWYPSMKIFQQIYPNNWEDVILKVSTEIEKKLEEFF